MARLNQIIAIEKGIKSRIYAAISDIYKAVQKPDLFSGVSRSYLPKDDDGETLPPERKRVQWNVPDVLAQVERLSTELMDVTARKDWTNCAARADVRVGDMTIASGVPVSYLLFLEKQLTDLHAFVTHLPELDDAETWTKDANSGLYRTEPTQTHRTKKVARAIVLYPATPEHPAQTQMVAEDIIAGFWAQTKQSGAIGKPDKQALAARVESLMRAVKEARESANMADEAATPAVGAAVFAFLYGDQIAGAKRPLRKPQRQAQAQKRTWRFESSPRDHNLTWGAGMVDGQGNLCSVKLNLFCKLSNPPCRPIKVYGPKTESRWFESSRGRQAPVAWTHDPVA